MWNSVHVVLLASVLTCACGHPEETKKELQTAQVIVDLEFYPVLQTERKLDWKPSNDSDSCFVGGHEYANGRRFTGQNVCIHYRCESGTPVLYREGCFLKKTGRCYGTLVDAWHQCHRYRCVKTTSSNFFYYNFIPVDIACCRGYDGRCKRLGEVFPYVINDRMYRKCTCSPVGDRQMLYECQTNQ